MSVSGRELWSIVAWGFLFLRMARTGYGETVCAIVAFLVGVASLYALDALAVDEMRYVRWPSTVKQSFRVMFMLHVILCIVLLVAGSLWGFQSVRFGIL